MIRDNGESALLLQKFTAKLSKREFAVRVGAMYVNRTAEHE